MSRQKSLGETLTFGQIVADKCSSIIGSWKFIIIQSLILSLWIILNVTLPKTKRWDPYPFILLNLMLSFQAAYTGPVLLMASNRQSEIDRTRSIENLELEHINYDHLVEMTKHIDTHFHKLNSRIDELENKNK